MPHPFAVIFDMDGVLVDSYHAHYQSWLEMARPRGLIFSEMQFRQVFGRTSRETIASLWGRRFDESEIAAMDAEKEAIFRRILDARFPAMPGVIESLTALANARFLLAVGSSAPPANVSMVLDRMRLRGRFAAVVNGSDVVRGKPDPTIFLLAAMRLGVPPSRCAVVEDAPLGIEAAHAAGMTAIGLASTGRTRSSLAAAELVIDSLTQLKPAVLRELIGR